MIGRLILLCAFIFPITLVNSDIDLLNGGYYCFINCIAKCVRNNTLSICRRECSNYNIDILCKLNSSECWHNCNDLVENSNDYFGPNKPENITVNYQIEDASKMNINWSTVDEAVLYIVQYKREDDSKWTTTETMDSFIMNISKPMAHFCSSYIFRIAAVSEWGSSSMVEKKLMAPLPSADIKISVLSIKYYDESYNYLDYYHANGTISVVGQYEQITKWPLGEDDLILFPLLHLIRCQTLYLNIFATPQFEKTSESKHLILVDLPSDTIAPRCQFLLGFSSIGSRRCGTRSSSQKLTIVLDINCDTVSNSPCRTLIKSPPPICGQIDHFSKEILNKESVDLSDLQRNVDVKITFEEKAPSRINQLPVLYYVIFYGLAREFPEQDQVAHLGVNLTEIIANVSTCVRLDENGPCVQNPGNKSSVILRNLKMDQLYGVRFCSVFDENNHDFRRFDPSDINSNMIKAERLILNSQTPFNPTSLLVSSAVLLLIVALFGYIFWQRRRQAMKTMEMKLSRIETKDDDRYTDLPKNDIWELDRRKLIIHNDKKLGSGAFGSVYLGRIIGKLASHKDANSALGVNLMRAENCQVAIKMLPEYADDWSKSEFLREINLMKSIGFHERMVNMLACVTESEPLCLVVEYCSQGDLLNFLRVRCKYMLKLDEFGVDYKNPTDDDHFDPDLVVTLKQLLMLTVQISYGLDYLSQRGLVHRDVAARNVLMHGNCEAKIGDFGLCRYIYKDNANYKGKGGRLPVKWMAPEAIKHYEFSVKSDVWSFGVFMFEVITLGGSPYPGIQPDDLPLQLDKGLRMIQPDNCPYQVMKDCWNWQPDERPEFCEIRQKLASQLEQVTEAYSYLKLDGYKDYYNMEYPDDLSKNTETESVEFPPNDSIPMV